MCPYLNRPAAPRAAQTASTPSPARAGDDEWHDAVNKEERTAAVTQGSRPSRSLPGASKPYRGVVALGLIGALARNDDRPPVAARHARDASLLEIGVADLTGDRFPHAGLESGWLAPWPPLGVAPLRAR